MATKGYNKPLYDTQVTDTPYGRWEFKGDNTQWYHCIFQC